MNRRPLRTTPARDRAPQRISRAALLGCSFLDGLLNCLFALLAGL